MIYNNVKRVLHNGVQYDSQTELNFHLNFPNVVRNTKRFVVWRAKGSNTEITYTPDFYDPKTKTYIEIKGARHQFADTAFQLRWLLAKDHIDKLVCLIPIGNKWVMPHQITEVKAKRRNFINSQLKELDNLINKRTRLKDWEKHYLVFLLCNDNIAWNGLKRGSMLVKKKQFAILRTKLLPSKDKIGLLSKLITKSV